VLKNAVCAQRIVFAIAWRTIFFVSPAIHKYNSVSLFFKLPMGLNVTGNLVDVDHSHNQLLNTGRPGNPVVQQIGLPPFDIQVYSTFQRHKTPRSKSRDRDLNNGDNCHLLYALKGKNGLQPAPGAMDKLWLHFDEIINDMMEQTGKYDVIVSMPSSHSISKDYAVRLASHYRCPVRSDLFEKISKKQAREMLEHSGLSSPDKRSVAKRLGKEDGDFSLKDIPTCYREYFPPVRLCADLPADCERFLLADDLLSTGTTLVSAKRLILASAPKTHIDAACLFSAV
jgi:hypothetical protein